jgi:hypothetical protein
MTARAQESQPPPDREGVSRAIHAHCERAQRRLRVLARERNDALLSSALRSVSSAAALSKAQLGTE